MRDRRAEHVRRAPRRPGGARLVALCGFVGMALTLSACTSAPSPPPGATSTAAPGTGSGATTTATPPSSTVSSTAPSSSASTAPPPPAQSCAASIVGRLSASERAGQLVMVGLDVGAGRSSLDSLVTQRHLGGVVLLGGWYGGLGSVRATTGHLAGLASQQATGGVGLFVAADQEGGAVQQLRGSGFDRMPSALTQGNLSDAALTSDATRWGRQVAAAGVNVNLAPVADTVPNDLGTANQPIGRWDREYSHHPDKVAAKSVAFLKGMHAGGVATSVKHFPGLGRITGNTDLTAQGITDSVTTTHDAYLQPFAAGIAAGTDFVMVGSAIYSRIDPGVNAVFSRAVITGLLRDQMGYRGVVISDDVGAAKSVAAVPVGQRATRFISAGGDIVLTARPSTVPTMLDAILARMKADPAFAAQVEAAVTRVVTLKVDRGLARCG